MFSPEAQDVGIVVLAGSLCRKYVTAQSRPYTPYFISGHAHAYARTAYQNALFKLA
jgi:hypothetical protein